MKNKLEVIAINLSCPSAPTYRCKAKSAPLLERLEISPSIKEAWLNKEGTVLVIVPTGSIASDAIKILRDEGFTPYLLKGKRRQSAIRDYPDLRWWARKDRIAPLQPADAPNVASAIVKRVAAKVHLEPANRLTIRSAVTARFLAAFKRPKLTTEEEIARDVISDTVDILSTAARQALKQAFADGLRPLPKEIASSAAK